MKKKLSILVLILGIVGITAGCGFYGVQGQNTAGFINKNQVFKTKPGVSENYILAKFGKPERKTTYFITPSKKNEKSAVQIRPEWVYCGNKKNTTTFLSVFHSISKKDQCVFFRFNRKHKLVKSIVKTY